MAYITGTKFEWHHSNVSREIILLLLAEKENGLVPQVEADKIIKELKNLIL